MIVNNSRLQEASSMAVYYRDSIWICYGNVVRLYSDQLAIFLVEQIDGIESPSSTTLIHVPEVGEFGEEWSGHILNRPVSKKGKEIEEHWQSQ